MTTLIEFAPAKLNLYLHITGRQESGYHDLDSLTAFASVGDEVRLTPAPTFGFKIEGPQAAALAGEEIEGNLAVKAARSLAELVHKPLKAHLTLVKNLPVASGIGGGSSDAAATLRALAKHWELAPDDPRIMEAAALHGQDVPVCVRVDNSYITATGVERAPRLPSAGVVLVNPNRAMPTPAVYKEFRVGGDAFSPLARLTKTPASVIEMVDMLRVRGNDLYAPACRLMPDIAAIVTAIANTSTCLLSRMSGSGATCFGLYEGADEARAAAAALRASNPRWWVEAGTIN